MNNVIKPNLVQKQSRFKFQDFSQPIAFIQLRHPDTETRWYENKRQQRWNPWHAQRDAVREMRWQMKIFYNSTWPNRKRLAQNKKNWFHHATSMTNIRYPKRLLDCWFVGRLKISLSCRHPAYNTSNCTTRHVLQCKWPVQPKQTTELDGYNPDPETSNLLV
jgi:hypothetical protein